MYNISTWISCFICKLKKKKIIFWGHGYYGDELGVKKIFRILFYKIPDINFLYGNRSKDLLEKMGFEQDRLVTVFNSLDYDKLKIIRENIDINYLSKLKRNLFPNSFDYPVIVFVGRLTKEKKIALLLNSIYLLKKDGVIFNLLIIGDGIDKNNIVDLSNSLQLTQHINFYGSCYDDSITGNLLLLSDVCVSPGHVGLTAIHSMSLGIPVITHNNFAKQAPEVEAIKQNYTGLFFKENDANDLAKVILDFVHIKKSIEFRINCINEVELNFTPLNQYNLITNSILKILESD
jgi:glycosyltransferase involved in cell wall biosynthesis